MTTEEAILAAAERLFCERGYALTSTVEIARLAGCNQPTVHYYFRSKDRLFEAIFQAKAALFMSTFMAIQDRELPFKDMLSECVRAHFDMLRANPQLPFLLMNELHTNPARVASLKTKVAPVIGRIAGRFDAALKAEIEKGTVRPMLLVDLMFTVISLNASVFLAAPLLSRAVLTSEPELEAFMNRRREDNVRLVLSFLYDDTHRRGQ